MVIERYFPGWDAPLTRKVTDYLLPSGTRETQKPLDLAGNLIVVPTRQAGRKLGEKLALCAVEQDSALLSPRIVTPSYFLHQENGPLATATLSEVKAIWAEVLVQADLNRYPALFPGRLPDQDYSWALSFGESLQNLRNQLADAELTIGNVAIDFDSILEETERWQDLARLETSYLDTLSQSGLEDPVNHMIWCAQNPAVAPSIKRIIVAAIADPTPLFIRALDGLSRRLPVTILIHAPDPLSHWFDGYGRPLADKWLTTQIDIPEPERNIFLSSSPSSQSRQVLQIIANQHEFGPADIAIGAPDEAVIPSLSAELGENRISTYDPSGKYITAHPIVQLIDIYSRLMNERGYSAFSTLLRHADMLAFFQLHYQVSALDLLTELDTYQNEHLPTSVDSIIDRLQRNESTLNDYPHLAKVVDFIAENLEKNPTSPPLSNLRAFLQTVYQHRILNSADEADSEFAAIAELVDSALRELESDCINSLSSANIHCFNLLLRRLASEKFYSERGEALIDLEGWLELPWEDAPLLIITGMNEGSVPDTHLSDVFLPDSLRKQLNLPHDETRLAADIFRLTSMIESRKREGRVCFIAGKTSASGDRLKPSGLLFKCPDDLLMDRIALLFGEPARQSGNHPATISFPLEATPPSDCEIGSDYISVTAFRDFLTCPFRFYLKHILEMKALDDRKRELDVMDFGSLIHAALHAFAQNQGLRQCENERELAQFLQNRAEQWISERFGDDPPLQVTIQLDAARERLAAAAHVQVQLAQDGWEIFQSEMPIRGQLNGMKVSGRIDRLDRHQQTGQIRIYDYKSSETAGLPEKIHLGSPGNDPPEWAIALINGKRKRWTDLQLPLYWLLLPVELASAPSVEIGYFNLPKAISDTGIHIWDSFSPDLLSSAEKCAGGVIDSIRNRHFWPPNPKVPFDDFAHLFPADIADCIKMQSFADFTGGE